MKPFAVKTPLKTISLVPSGLTPFVIYGIWHIGVIEGKFGAKDNVVLGFEFPNLPPIEYKEENGTTTRKPRALCQTYTNSMSKKSQLRALLESWRGKAFTDEEAKTFDLQKIMGACGQANIIHEQRGDATYANIGTLLKGPKVHGSIPQQLFSVTQLDNAAELKMLGLPDWIVKRVETSEDYMELLQNGGRLAKSDPSTAQPDGPPDNPDDDSSVPF